MELEELFCQLSYGQLSNLALSNMGSGEIVEARKPQLTNYVNDGLVQLYSRFKLKEKDVLVEMVEGVTFYHLLKIYTESSYDENSGVYPYIKDLNGEIFDEDVLKIHAVFDNTGMKRPLNDSALYRSVYTPQHNVLQNPNPQKGEVLSLLYQARHPIMECNPADPTTNIIELPLVLHGALKHFVAGQVFGDMNTAESSAKAMDHLQMYESICMDVEARDMVSTSVSTSNEKFCQRGFK